MIFYTQANRIRAEKGGKDMETRKLLIADETEEFRSALAQALQGTFRVRTCTDGKEALELLRSFGPDVLVLDLMLPGLDGISLLQSAVASGFCPIVLATSRFINDYVLESVSRLGIGYVVRKPCDIRATAARIADLCQNSPPAPYQQPESHGSLSNTLLALGIPPKRNGYRHLREAVPLMAANPMQSVTKELYPAVAKLCHCDSSSVERSIRTAISSAWEHRDDRVWRLYFPPDASGSIPRPTNATFISRLADILQPEQPAAAE